jgi:hypothetical protein
VADEVGVKVLVLEAGTFLGTNRRALPHAEEGDVIEIIGGHYAADMISQGFVSAADDAPVTLGAAPEKQETGVDREITVTKPGPTIEQQGAAHRTRRQKGTL